MMAAYELKRIGRIGRIAAALLCLGGCAPDHRISLSQFLAMQEGDRAPGAISEAAEQESLDLSQHLGPYKAGPGDVLQVTLTRADQTAMFPQILSRIDRKGEVDMPVVGAVKVGDMELEDVEDAIRNAYVPNVLTECVVHVELGTADTTNVLVMGAVGTPGLIPLRRTERNMLFAIVGAGGVSSTASGTATLRRIRHPGRVETVTLTNPVELNKALALAPLEAGDIVYVEAAQPNNVYVGGLVNRTGAQASPAGVNLTVLQAVAAAGGLRTDVTPTQGTLIRRLPSGRDVQVKLDMQRIATGRDPNLTLQAGDILWVPDTLGTRIEDFINQNLFFRAGMSVNYSVSGTEFLNRNGQRGGGGTGSLQDAFDPFGFLNQNNALQGITNQTRP